MPASAEQAIARCCPRTSCRRCAVEHPRAHAFQEQGQGCGYLVDPTNVLGGQAERPRRSLSGQIWGTIHLLAPLNNGVPSQAASALVTQFTVAKLKTRPW